MRITDQMTTNKMLLNITRNQTKVDWLYTQMTTGKKIQMASDDPIVASRALKFRTNVSQTEQYIKNVQQGLSWMNITEQGFSNTTEILKSIREKCVEGSSDTFTYDDRQKISTAISAFADQVGLEMNISYAGRYVFSGYRTDKPPIIEQEDTTASFDITQNFTISDIELGRSYVKETSDSAPEVSETMRLKLPYTNVTFAAGSQLVPYDTVGNAGTGLNIVTIDMTDAVQRKDAYNPPLDQVNYIPETGELIINQTNMTDLRAEGTGGLEIKYNKTGLAAGDLNPIVYFECRDTINGVSYNMDNQKLQYEVSINTKMTINSLAKDVVTPNLYADLRALVDLLNGVSLTPESELVTKYRDLGLSEEEVAQAVKDQISEETQKYRGVMQKSFSNMLSIIDSHASQISEEYTALGSKMNRLELIQNRLKEDRVSYTELMSTNEDVDYLEVIMNLSSAEYVYNAALKSGGSISQISLVDYIS